MMRRKLTIGGIIALLALAAGVVAVVSCAPTTRSQFDQLREGMTYDEVVAVLDNYPTAMGSYGHRGGSAIWWSRHGTIVVSFDANHRLKFCCFRDAEPVGFLDRVLSRFGF